MDRARERSRERSPRREEGKDARRREEDDRRRTTRHRSRSRSRSRDRGHRAHSSGGGHRRHHHSSSRDRHADRDDDDRKHRKRDKRDKEERRERGSGSGGERGAGAARQPLASASAQPAPQPPPPAAAALAPPPPAAARPKGGKKGDDGGARIAAMFGYTADNNPFGDAKLTETFVWGKKIAAEIAAGTRSAAPSRAEQRAARDELVDEIERAKARRSAREAEREEMERLRAEEARLRDSEQHAGWERAEEEFHRRQTATRSLIRIRDGREKPVDILAKNALLVDLCESCADVGEEANRGIATAVELHPPATVFGSLPAGELADLARDIATYSDYEGATGGGRTAYWRALGVCVDAEVRRARAREAGLAAGTSLAALTAVEDEVDAMFAGKTDGELADSEEAIRATIRSGLAAAGGGGGGGGGGAGGAAGGVVDVEYWESVLAHLQLARARSTVARIAEETLLTRLKQLEDRRDVFAAAGLVVAPPPPPVSAAQSSHHEFDDAGGEPGTDDAAAAGAHATSAAPGAHAAGAALPGSYSPELIPFDERADRAAAAAAGGGEGPASVGGELEPVDQGAVGQRLPLVESTAASASAAAAAAAAARGSGGGGVHALDEAEDRRRLLARRIELLRASGVLPPAPGSAAAAAQAGGVGAGAADGGLERTFTDEGGRTLPTGFGEADLGAGAEVAPGSSASRGSSAAAGSPAPLPPQHALMSPHELRAWQDKYRPRKPRFFNRVRTGYDWNRYNKSHYDFDNPPPKTVQGYKFNIFYPDLLDRSRTPRYFLEPADSDEYCIIRFTSGPPYEDVAFKIVNREWDTGKKHGFRCSFDKGVLQLHVNFKRMFWRK